MEVSIMLYILHKKLFRRKTIQIRIEARASETLSIEVKAEKPRIKNYKEKWKVIKVLIIFSKKKCLSQAKESEFRNNAVFMLYISMFSSGAPIMGELQL
jgi:hypothetical protein